jgi:hypothetical protein
MDLAQRVARLEATCRRWRWIASASVLLLVALVTMGQSASEPGDAEYGTVTVRNLIVRDSSGRLRAMLTGYKEPGLTVLDREGNARISLTLSLLTKVPGLGLYGDGPKQGAVLMSSSWESNESGPDTMTGPPCLVLTDKAGEVVFRTPRPKPRDPR